MFASMHIRTLDSLIHLVPIGLAAIITWAVLSLGKAGRSPGWWCMLAGSSLIVLFFGLASATDFVVIQIGAFYRVVFYLLEIGLPLFAIGFAIHSQHSARLIQRASELEQACSGMAAEIGATASGQPSHRH